jgi:hypothetical protein
MGLFAALVMGLSQASAAAASVHISFVTPTINPGGVGVVRASVSRHRTSCSGTVTGPSSRLFLPKRRTTTGHVRWTFNLPSDAASGQWQVRIACAHGGAASASFTVPPPPPLPPPPPPAVGTRSNPFPLGTDAHDSRWNVRVSSVNWDAYSAIAAVWPTMPAPPTGLQDVMVNVTVTWLQTNEKTDPSFELDPSFDVVAGNGNPYYNRTGGGILQACGGVPDSLDDVTYMLPNTPVTGNLCWQVLSTDVSSLELHYENQYSGGEGWFALR